MARTLALILAADVAGYLAGLTKANQATDQWQKKTTAAGKGVDETLKRTQTQTRKTADQIKADFNSQAQVAERANQRLITSLRQQEAELIKVQQASKKYGRLSAFTDAHSSGLDTAARGLGAFGAAAGLAFGAAVKAAADFDQSMSEVKATGQDAAKNIGSLRDLAIQWGAKTQFSATQAADGITQLAKAGVQAKDILGGGLEGALNLAAAGQIDVGAAAEDAASAMTQFGLKGKDVPHIADLMAAAAGKAQGEVSDMGTALKYVGPVASQMGISIEQTSGAIAELASNGILADQAGTGLRGMLTALTSPSKKAAETMKAYGVEVYNARGQFVGFDGVAKQLHDGLAHVSAATRDQALGQIFGNEQITAARILMQGSAKDIDRWTNAVNDQGFAARAASTKMDNLKGDLENLRGAWETALIGAGEGQTGGLRDATQMLTDIVNAWNHMPDAVKSAVGRVLGSLSLLGLGGAAVIKVLQGIGKMRKAMVDMGGASGPIKAFQELRAGIDGNGEALTKLGRNARLAQVGIPLIGVALAAVSVAVGYFADQQAKAKALSDTFGTALDTVTGKLTQQNIALNENVQQNAITSLTQAGAYKAARTLGLTYNDVTKAALGNTDAIAKVNAAISQADTAGRLGRQSMGGYQVSQDAAANAARTLDSAVNGTTKALQSQIGQKQEARKATDAYSTSTANAEARQKAFQQQVDAAKQTLEGAGQATGGMSDRMIIFKAKVQDARTALEDQGLSTKGLTDQQILLQQAEQGVVAETQKMIDKFTILRDGALSQERANEQWQTSLDNLAKSTETNRKSLISQAKAQGMGKEKAKAWADQQVAAAHSMDIGTEAGRKNRQSVIDAVSALNDRVTADFKAEASSKKYKTQSDALRGATKLATREMEAGRKKILASGDAAELSRGKVKGLTDRMLLTPAQIKTEVQTPGMQTALDNVNALNRQAGKLDGTHKIKFDMSYTASADGTKINFGHRQVSASPMGKATGGFITGPGTATSDDVPAWLSNGEYVVRASSVSRIGRARLDYLNHTGDLPRFRDGGMVNHGPLNSGPNAAVGPAVVGQVIVESAAAKGMAQSVVDTVNAITSQVGAAGAEAVRALFSGGGVRMGSDRLVNWHGGRFTENFANHLKLAYQANPFQVYQGGWNPGGVAASGSTHDKDAVDAGPSTVGLARALREVGVAAWQRTPAQGPWMAHVHGVPGPNVGEASPAAARQYQDYLSGGNGLGGKDDGPHVALMDLSGLSGLSGGVSGTNQRLGKAMMLAHGWPVGQWPALRALWQGESGWSAYAVNSRSGAYGIPQALGHGHPYGLGDTRGQIAWGLDYIGQRYGSPSNAYATWLSRKPHWYSSGGAVSGPGSGTSDDIPAWLSNGEYVIRAAAVNALGRPFLDHLNAQGYASGGQVTAGYPNPGGFNVSALVALIKAINNPIQSLRNFTAAVNAATRANNAAQSQVGKHATATRRLDRATQVLQNARDAQSALRLNHAQQTHDARAAVATASTRLDAARLALGKVDPAGKKAATAQRALVSAQNSRDAKARANAEQIAKINDKIRTAKKGSLTLQNLINQRELTQTANAREMAAADTKVAKAKSAAAKSGVDIVKVSNAQALVTRRQTQLDKAREAQSKLSRDNTLSSAKATARVAAALKARNAAQATWSKLSDTAKKKAADLAQAEQNLAQQQQAVADAAKQVADAFTSAYLSKSSAVADWLQAMNLGTKDIADLSTKITRLRKMGLSEALIQQILSTAQSNGAPAGASIASAIIAGGDKTIKSLNAAATSLQSAADLLGFKAATGTVRAAAGGFITGPGTGRSDSISARLSNGEYVVNAAATATNRRVLDAINYGGAPGARFAGGGFVGGGISHGQLIDALSTLLDSRPVISGNHIGYDPRSLLAEIDRQRARKLHANGVGVFR